MPHVRFSQMALLGIASEATGGEIKIVGLANDISVSESYGTSPHYGIGNADDPAIVPNLYSARLSIRRATFDRRSLYDIGVVRPELWYIPQMHQQAALPDASALDRARLVEDFLTAAQGSGAQNVAAVSDHLFMTYVVLLDKLALRRGSNGYDTPDDPEVWKKYQVDENAANGILAAIGDEGLKKRIVNLSMQDAFVGMPDGRNYGVAAGATVVYESISLVAKRAKPIYPLTLRV